MPAATVFFDLGDTLVFNNAAGVSTRFSDALDVLQVLQERGWRIGLLSNQAAGTTVAQVQARLAAQGLARWIEPTLLTISTEVSGNIGKPARPVFDLALARAGLAATPAQAVFVTEEAAHVAAARSFGCRAIVLKRNGVCNLADGECNTSLAGLLGQLPAPAALTGTNLDLAPPPKLVDGLWAVPVDIARIDAALNFDAAAQTASGDATLQFRLGAHGGCPVFDLRQTPTVAELDGAPLPLADIAVHDFGGGPGAELRVLARPLDAGSTHTLRVAYALGLPQAPMVGSYLPQLAFSAGPRLVFNFGFTDLGPGRYAEAFIPANLIFDQFELVLDLRLTGTAIPHEPVTNGEVTVLGANHWRVAFPARFTALSPMLELRAADALASATHAQVLPVSGATVNVSTWKPAGSAVNLVTLASQLGGHLADNENSSGPYLHGARFTAFVHQGGMEYDGATTSSPGPLRHEAFHSWWGRGLKPASQADGWFDEAWTVYNENGAAGVLPLNFSDPPVALSPRNPWVRSTPSASYSAGERLWKGLAAVLGVQALRARMNDFHARRHARPVSTEALEAHLLASSGRSEVVDAFHRFVYGLPDPQPLPDLWLRDDGGDTGSVPFNGGRFWDSPDLWVRNRDDGGLVHQNPEAGQDNWFYARVRNRSATATARHLAVSFNPKFFAGSQFTYPADWLPAVTAAVAFDVGPGETRILKARWPRAQVPPAGTHPCLLAAVFSRFDAPVAGKHVWEQNNLAQKNLTVVNLKPDGWFILPFVVAQLKPRIAQVTTIELRRPAKLPAMKATLLAPKALLGAGQRRVAVPIGDAAELQDPRDPRDAIAAVDAPNEGEDSAALMDCACSGHASLAADAVLDDGADQDAGALLSEFTGHVELPFAAGERAELAVKLRPQEPTRLGLRFQLPRDAQVGARFVVDVVQRIGAKVVGGVAVEINVVR